MRKYKIQWENEGAVCTGYYNEVEMLEGKANSAPSTRGKKWELSSINLFTGFTDSCGNDIYENEARYSGVFGTVDIIFHEGSGEWVIADQEGYCESLADNHMYLSPLEAVND